MNTNNPQDTIITLEVIAQRKAEKLEEVRKVKEQMNRTARELFAPIAPSNGMDAFMQNVNSGIAIYDGVMTGIKIMKRISSYFQKKKR